MHWFIKSRCIDILDKFRPMQENCPKFVYSGYLLACGQLTKTKQVQLTRKDLYSAEVSKELGRSAEAN